MAVENRFAWAEGARLFAGVQELLRPPLGNSDTFRPLPATPTVDALAALGAAITQRAPFCLSDRPLPESLTCPPGAFLTLTGGASGLPKAVRRSQRSWTASFAVNADRFALRSTDSVAVLGQLSHSLSLYAVLEALHLGLDTHVLAQHSPRAQAARISKVGATLIYATPTQLRLLARGAAAPLPSLRLVLCGGGALDAATRAAVETLCPNAALHVFYGAAETSFITLADAGTPEGSVGQPYPGVELRLLDEKGRPTFGVGEIWVRSPYLFDGYALGDSPDTRWHDGFVTVGEMGELDANGQLWIKGRRQRMVQIADQLVFPEAVEAMIAAREGTACAVLPRADPLRGQQLVAVVEGPEIRAQAEKIIETCRAELGPLASPRRVYFRPDLPLLPSGKPDLCALSTWLETQS
ncbi:putative acyl--CoA ligase YhfT [Sulfitobacter sp. DSM 110093]|uniref:AMP-binding protein n=1 Tax=Sulfitobacter sp. DSM 110093 TaxID=2883127 RepID=UPI001FAE430E|nr:AMP-binding protein [Sulfitobacter sp. DSM 110093]UOA33350.1 putative acyl--CoA ligase YhfT [Sulfitobacter sp. DSM 110093]